MNRFLHPSLLVLVAILSTASMCEDDDDKNDVGNQTVEARLGQGSWKVAYFFDKTDETSDFEGYTLLFNDDNVAIATKNALSVQGSWDTEDSSDGDTKLYLDFGANGPLEELNEDWVVMESSSSRISLEHVSGGNGDTDALILERK
ncbi:MAG TPA: hypothetical protein VK589_13055 [Chryseolinea sp.]|nr:hypothetical protein [Chryseolinea sp.]